MVYRDFGNTGIKVSALGFGAMRLPMEENSGESRVNDELAIPMIRRAYEGGVNYFDTAWGYCGEQSQYTLGKALKDIRDKVYISTKLPLGHVNETADFDKMLNEALRRINTDHIDFYHFHGIGINDYKNKILPLKLLDRAEKALADGRIRHLSFSFHDNPANMKLLADTGAFSSLLCQYNLIDQSNGESMAYCREKGLGIVVMGPLGGGNIVNGGKDFLDKFSTNAESAAELAWKFVWGNKNVCCALSGMRTMADVEDNLRLAEGANSISEQEWGNLVGTSSELSSLAKLYCTGCRYCDVCPNGIKPFKALTEFNRWRVWGLQESAFTRYKDAVNKGELNIDSCAACGACASKCPQKIDIPAELQKIRQAFQSGKL